MNNASRMKMIFIKEKKAAEAADTIPLAVKPLM
jgi:hypothetical protein